MEHLFRQAFLVIFSWLCYELVRGFIYDDPFRWPESDYFCGSCLQSPINLISKKAQTVSLQRLIFENFNRATNSTYLVNDGESVHLKVDPYLNASVTGGNNDELFETEMVYFHWGETSRKGTEHAVDFVHEALELQIVNRNVAYPEEGLAYRAVNGFLNLAILFQEVDNTRRVPYGMKNVCALLHLVSMYNETLRAEMPRSFTLASLFTGLDVENYITYCGSHTTPPCTPNVIWIVFPNPLEIDRNCMFKFRAVMANNGKNMTTTVRPLQVAGSRKIFYNV